MGHHASKDKYGRRVYGRWAGNEKGHLEDPTRCVASVYVSDSYISSQCRFKRGKGRDGEYCGIHARQFPAVEDDTPVVEKEPSGFHIEPRPNVHISPLCLYKTVMDVLNHRSSVLREQCVHYPENPDLRNLYNRVEAARLILYSKQARIEKNDGPPTDADYNLSDDPIYSVHVSDPKREHLSNN